MSTKSSPYRELETLANTLLRSHAEDALHEVQAGQKWAAAIFRAIGRAGDLEEAFALAEIGSYVVERSAGIVSSDLEDVKDGLTAMAALLGGEV